MFSAVTWLSKRIVSSVPAWATPRNLVSNKSRQLKINDLDLNVKCKAVRNTKEHVFMFLR